VLLVPAKDVRPAAEAIAVALTKGPIQLLFVCTHNSRRSQLSEALAAHRWQGDPRITVRSCGTEQTSCHPSTARALEDLGWDVRDLGNGKFQVQRDQTMRSLWSKTLDEVPRDLPIVAMMTCAEADEVCPAIVGAVARIPWRYPDPKTADGTPQSRATYRTVAEAISRDLDALYHELKPNP
jgi:protein-tyrosine-phosphatase